MQNYTRAYRFGPRLLIPTSVNDHPEELFELNSGMFDNTISQNAARESTNIYSNGRTYIQGINGRKEVNLTEVSLAFAHFREKKTIVALDLTNVSNSAGTEISGMLGFGMLVMLDVKIDYRDGLVDFTYDPNRHH
jgi:hypothetical protein